MNPIEWYSKHLHPGDMLIRKSDGLRIIKCAEAWNSHYITEHNVFNVKTGTIHHVSEFVQGSMGQFFSTFEIKYA